MLCILLMYLCLSYLNNTGSEEEDDDGAFQEPNPKASDDDDFGDFGEAEIGILSHVISVSVMLPYK